MNSSAVSLVSFLLIRLKEYMSVLPLSDSDSKIARPLGENLTDDTIPDIPISSEETSLLISYSITLPEGEDCDVSVYTTLFVSGENLGKDSHPLFSIEA
ncbi:hypothetical protein ANAPH1_00802 [Anaplasma phagocytophilum]|nr:hypothetical protein ANAPH1_00802 [Anaplasma phagocytophilum]